jgi:hypothetical protein
VATPGLTGKNSVQGTFVGASKCKGTCSAGRITSDVVPVTPGGVYKVTYATWLDGSTSGFIGLMINGGGQRTTDVSDYPSQWNFIQHTWLAPVGTTSANMVLEWYGPPGRFDTITFAPVTAYCGPNPPLGVLGDGEFECGLGGWSQQVPDSNTVAGVQVTDGMVPANQGLKAYGHAWVASTQGPNRSQQEYGASARIVSAGMPVTPGKTYMLAFTAYFNAFNIGFIGVKINNAPLMTRDPGDPQQGINNIAPNQWFWTAPAGVTTATVTFEACFSGAGVMAVDSVILVEAQQSS